MYSLRGEEKTGAIKMGCAFLFWVGPWGEGERSTNFITGLSKY